MKIPQLALLLCLMSVLGASAEVLPPHAIVGGKTIGEWTADWWKWLLALPVDQSPWFDETGEKASNGQTEGPIFFLVGVVNETGRATRSIAITEGRHLLVPIVNLLNNSLGENPWGTITEELLDSGAEVIAQTDHLEILLNQESLTNHQYVTGQKVTDLFGHRELSPEFAPWLPPTNNVFQAFGFDLAGIVDPCFSDGYWVMLTPLPVGRHELVFRGGFGPPTPFSLEVTYRITVHPLSLTQAVDRLLEQLKQTPLSARHLDPLRAKLTNARKAFASGKLRKGIKSLQAFQKEVRSRVEPLEQDWADLLSTAARQIIEKATAQLEGDTDVKGGKARKGEDDD